MWPITEYVRHCHFFLQRDVLLHLRLMFTLLCQIHTYIHTYINLIYKSNSGVCLYVFFFSFHLFHTFWGKKDCLQGDHVQLSVCLFLFFSFISHVLGKKGMFTRVITYNAESSAIPRSTAFS
jgi:hypothetical protein